MSVSPVGTLPQTEARCYRRMGLDRRTTRTRWGVSRGCGGSKSIDPQSSVAAVRAYRLLPSSLVTIVGWGLPFAEIALGVLLLAGIATRLVAVASAVLLLVFIAAVISAAARGLSIDCGCFGGGGEVAPGQTAYGTEIVRDVGLLLLAAWLVWQPRSRLTLDRFSSERDVIRESP